MKRLAIVLAALVLVAGWLMPMSAQQALTRAEVTANDIDASLRTDWYGLYLQGKKIGYFQTSRDKTADGVRESFRMHMKLLSFGQKAEMNLVQVLLFEPKAPYGLIKGEFTEDAGDVISKFVFSKMPSGEFQVIHTAGKVERKKIVKSIDYSLADTMATELWLLRGAAKDAEITVRDLEPKEQKLETQKSKVLSFKSSLVGGVPVKYYEIESESSNDEIRVLSRHDDKGRMISGKIAIFELRAETEAQAKNTEFSKDLFVLGMAKIDQPLGPLTKVKELVLKVDGAAEVFEDGPRQSLIGDKGAKILRLGKRYGKDVKATKEEIEENLKETSTYDLSHVKVKAMASKAVGEAKTDADKVRNITKFVHDFVEPHLGNTMPTIHDLMERKRGDCKSYALLFTNLARANGVPSREVSGLLYIGDDGKAFGGHAWNEVVINGLWVPIDASLNETEVNATHLSLGTDKRAAKNLLESMGNISLKVVEIQKTP